jgi:hypothetical protein
MFSLLVSSNALIGLIPYYFHVIGSSVETSIENNRLLFITDPKIICQAGNFQEEYSEYLNQFRIYFVLIGAGISFLLIFFMLMAMKYWTLALKLQSFLRQKTFDVSIQHRVRAAIAI